jgi:V8-like Glu-specific endopeptidase
MTYKFLRLSQALLIFLIVAIQFGDASFQGTVVAASPISITGEEFQEGEISARSDPSGAGWKAAVRPWTKERMLAAKPADLIGVEGEPAMSIEVTQPDILPGSIPSSPPENAEVPLAPLDEFNPVEFASPLGYSYPAPFTRYQHFQDQTAFPYSTVGVLFFSMNGVDYRCSAASIGNHAIWTAGHCVHAGNGLGSGWAYDVSFVPAYKDGAAPFGIWTAHNLWTGKTWYTSGDLRYDMGGAVLNTNGSDKKISEVVGNLGFNFGQSRTQHWTDLGYPSTPPFTGNSLQICLASHAYDDPNFGDPAPLAIGCDLTGGSSGGPWITNFSGVGGATNYLNGHNSYRYTEPNHPLEIYSPYFGSEAKSLRDTLVSGSPSFIFLPVINALQ